MLMECPADQSALPDVSTLPGRPIVHASETVPVPSEHRHGRLSAMTVVKAAAVQISPVLYSREGTVEKVVQKILEAGPTGRPVRDLPRDRRALLPLLLLRAAPFDMVRSTCGCSSRR